jgi:hypothetical protein
LGRRPGVARRPSWCQSTPHPPGHSRRPGDSRRPGPLSARLGIGQRHARTERLVDSNEEHVLRHVRATCLSAFGIGHGARFWRLARCVSLENKMYRSNVEAPGRQELCGKFEDPLRCTSSQSPSDMVIDGRST